MDRLDISGNDRGAVSAAGEEAGLPREVYSLLANANLLRMRGLWEEAVDNCMTALRLAPDSSSAQSLLGDIYENQGRVDDAIQWYHMALDAHPDSPADRLKLNRLLQRQQAPLRPARAPGTQGDALAEPAPMSQMRRLMKDPETLLRYGAIAATLLVFLVVAFAYSSVHRRAALASFGLGPDQEVRLKPVVVPTAESASGAPAGAGTVSRDATEQTVLDALRSRSDLSSQSITVNDVQFDPRAGHVTLTVTLTPDGSLTRLNVLKSALLTAEAVAAASPSAALFTVRCLSPAAGGASLLFVGDAARSAVPSGTAPPPTDAQVQEAWTEAWWSPQAPE